MVLEYNVHTLRPIVLVLLSQHFEKALSVVSFFVVAAFIYMYFRTYSTSYCCHYKLMDPLNVCIAPTFHDQSAISDLYYTFGHFKQC
jgi:hypothetical protein